MSYRPEDVKPFVIELFDNFKYTQNTSGGKIFSFDKDKKPLTYIVKQIYISRSGHLYFDLDIENQDINVEQFFTSINNDKLKELILFNLDCFKNYYADF